MIEIKMKFPIFGIFYYLHSWVGNYNTVYSMFIVAFVILWLIQGKWINSLHNGKQVADFCHYHIIIFYFL